MSENEMEVLAKASFYIQDIIAGRIGEFEITEEGWGAGDGPRALAEVKECLLKLKEAGFKDDLGGLRSAPYSHNVNVGCFTKEFDHGDRTVIMTLTTRFGIHAKFSAQRHALLGNADSWSFPGT